MHMHNSCMNQGLTKDQEEDKDSSQRSLIKGGIPRNSCLAQLTQKKKVKVKTPCILAHSKPLLGLVPYRPFYSKVDVAFRKMVY